MHTQIMGNAGVMTPLIEALPVASAPANPSLALQRTTFVALLLWGVGALWLEGLASVGLGVIVLLALFAWRHQLTDGLSELWSRWHLLLVFVSWALIAPFLAGHAPTGTGVGRLFDWMSLPAVVWAWHQLSPSQVRRLLISWGGLFAVSCFMAACQYFGTWPAQEKLEGLRRLTHLHVESAYQVPMGVPGRFYGVGIVFHRLKFAHVGALLTIFTTYAALRTRGRWRWLGFGLAALSIAAITQFALVRGASVALVIALALMWVLMQPRPGRALWLGGLGALVIMVLLALQPAVRARFGASMDPKSNGDRSYLWAAGLRAWQSSPLVGVGFDQFHPGRFPSDDMPDHIQKHGGKAHNQFLTYAAETGAPGALLFVVMLAWFTHRLFKDRVAGAAGIASIAFFVLLSLLHDPLFHAQFSMAFVLALGATLAMMARSPSRDASVPLQKTAS